MTLGGDLKGLQLLWSSECGDMVESRAFRNPEVASKEFSKFLSDVGTMAKFRWLLRTSFGGAGNLSDELVIEQIVRFLSTGRLRVVRHRDRETGPAESGAGGEAPASKPEKQRTSYAGTRETGLAEEKDAKEKTWIGIQLLDSDGNPVSGEPYKITLPDGRVVTGSLDSSGTARVTDIDPGTCQVTFPNLDATSWAKGAPAA